jgi:hypothetical protein
MTYCRQTGYVNVAGVHYTCHHKVYIKLTFILAALKQYISKIANCVKIVDELDAVDWFNIFWAQRLTAVLNKK